MELKKVLLTSSAVLLALSLSGCADEAADYAEKQSSQGYTSDEAPPTSNYEVEDSSISEDSNYPNEWTEFGVPAVDAWEPKGGAWKEDRKELTVTGPMLTDEQKTAFGDKLMEDGWESQRESIEYTKMKSENEIMTLMFNDSMDTDTTRIDVVVYEIG